jgi:hypothetical protein
MLLQQVTRVSQIADLEAFGEPLGGFGEQAVSILVARSLPPETRESP